MRAAALRIELHIPGSGSLKAKRRTLKPIIEGLRRRLSVSVAEVDHQDTWQRATVGIAIVAADAKRLDEMITAVRDYVDSHDPEAVVVGMSVDYLEEHG